MSDNPISKARSDLMRRVGLKDTAPELAVRRIAHAMGLRFRLHRRDLPGTPDLVFPRHRTAMFVHGCFWHRHQGCRRCTAPKTRPEFWSAKFAANIVRDARKAAELELEGWRVLTIWECEATKSDRVRAVLGRVAELSEPNRGRPRRLTRAMGAT